MRVSPHVTTLLLVIALITVLSACQAAQKVSYNISPPVAQRGAVPDRPGSTNATPNTTTNESSTKTATHPATVHAAQLTQVLNPKALPLGDGNVSSAPKRGSVYSCDQTFRQGGAEHLGPWIHGSTWDSTAKTTVRGHVSWPNARFSISVQGSRRVFTGNDLPVDEPTGSFPIARNDPAYAIDTNPNAIEQQNLSFSLPLDPTFATQPSCVPMGMVGIATDGVAIFNALDDSGRDAAAHEVQDRCDGHPQSGGIYHYHSGSTCIPGMNGSAHLIGYALDGFGIYSPYSENGTEITNAQLDACHGTTSAVMWNGKLQNVYHYVITREYPYTIGCFKGTPIRVQLGSSQQRPRPNAPPPRIA